VVEKLEIIISGEELGRMLKNRCARENCTYDGDSDFRTCEVYQLFAKLDPQVIKSSWQIENVNSALAEGKEDAFCNCPIDYFKFMKGQTYVAVRSEE